MLKLLLIFLCITGFLSNANACGCSMSEMQSDSDMSYGVDFLGFLVNSDKVDNIQKIHCLVELSRAYLSMGCQELYFDCMDKIKDLCLKDPKCDEEFWRCYEWSFILHPYKISE